VLIITDEAIFSFGLKVQFQRWNFDSIEISHTCQHALQRFGKQLPSLVIMDEKFLADQACGGIELIADLVATPLILLSPSNAQFGSLAGNYKITNHYTYLPKPFQIADLQAAVENLLGMTIEAV
jgi:DNA-binding response OmpR family regulator